MLRTISELGIKSDYLYAAGLVSVALTYASWAVSRLKLHQSKDDSDRLGLFIGEWPPTFIALGTALKLEELERARQKK